MEDSINEALARVMKEYDIPHELIKQWASDAMDKAIDGGMIINLEFPAQEDKLKGLEEFPKLQRFVNNLL